MLFEDSQGKLFTSDEVDDLSSWEFEEKEIHVYGDGWPE